MAHELTQRADGMTEMAYVGDLPWHGLGQKLDEDASISDWIKAAGMDWTIRKTPVQYYADRAQTKLIEDEDQRVLCRSDNGYRLGIVSDNYEIVQPFEVLEFFRDLVAGHNYKVHTAGTLFGGRRYWALAKMGEMTVGKLRKAGMDNVGGFLLFYTGADGSVATEVRETTVRVVCNNTVQMALGETGREVIRITHRNTVNTKKIHDQLSDARDHFAAWIDAANQLASVKISTAAAEDFVMHLLRPKDDLDTDDSPSRKPRGFDTILALFEGGGMGSNLPSAKDTAWGVVNAVSEYIDHHATAKTPSHALDRSLFGSGAKLKMEAFELATDTWL
jgi:phage/plasmid-like protein (TIGR03299 family)